MNYRRLVCALTLVPLAFYAYACSSDSTEQGTTATPQDDGGTTTVDSGGGTSVKDSGAAGDAAVTVDAGDSGVRDAGIDSAVAAPTCIGNPLLALADAGTPDGGVTASASSVVQIVTGAGGLFLDGPQWVAGPDGGADGFLVYSEYQPSESVRRVAADGGAPGIFRATGLSTTVAPIGNAFRNGFVLTTATGKGGTPPTSVLFQTAPDGGVGPTIAVGTAASPNDLVVGKGGAIYFTDPRYQAGALPKGVYATAADGGAPTRFTNLVAADEPNGIALSPDGTKLYVSFTNSTSPSTKRIDSYPVAADGTVGTTATTVVPAASLTDYPDGLAVDIGGNLYVAEAVAGSNPGGRVQVFSATGQKLGEIPFASARPTGVAFGGAQNAQLFITVENGVYVFTGRCAGTP